MDGYPTAQILTFSLINLSKNHQLAKGSRYKKMWMQIMHWVDYLFPTLFTVMRSIYVGILNHRQKNAS